MVSINSDPFLYDVNIIPLKNPIVQIPIMTVTCFVNDDADDADESAVVRALPLLLYLLIKQMMNLNLLKSKLDKRIDSNIFHQEVLLMLLGIHPTIFFV